MPQRPRTMRDAFMETKEGALIWNQERSILETTELICAIMEEKGVSRAELADLLGKSRGYVTQLLDGATNMTLRTISDTFTVLGYEFHPTATPNRPSEHLIPVGGPFEVRGEALERPSEAMDTSGKDWFDLASPAAGLAP